MALDLQLPTYLLEERPPNASLPIKPVGNPHPTGRQPIPEGERKIQLSQLWHEHREMIRLAVEGYKRPEIAAALKVTPQTVTNTLNCDLGRAHLETLQAERDAHTVSVSRRIADACVDAVATIEDIATGRQAGSPSDKVRASLALLDRGGAMGQFKGRRT